MIFYTYVFASVCVYFYWPAVLHVASYLPATWRTCTISALKALIYGYRRVWMERVSEMEIFKVDHEFARRLQQQKLKISFIKNKVDIQQQQTVHWQQTEKVWFAILRQLVNNLCNRLTRFENNLLRGWRGEKRSTESDSWQLLRICATICSFSCTV